MSSEDDILYLMKMPTTSSGRRKIVYSNKELKNCINYISRVHKGAKYLDGVTPQEFLFKEYLTLEDGKYVVVDENTDEIVVFKLKFHTSEGYLFTSSYRKKEEKGHYHVIQGSTK